jgi:AcrR family transcriptional regulator
MPRPSLHNEKRRELTPVVAQAFAELGYRRTSTAELAERCGVQENILYRLWPDKKAMFIAAIEYVYELAAQTWQGVAGGRDSGSVAEQLLAYESEHLGEFGHSRIVFAGLSELDDPDIRRALSQMYERYQKFVREQVKVHRHKSGRRKKTDEALTAWAMIGLGTVALIARELKLLGDRDRRRLLAEVGHELLG